MNYVFDLDGVMHKHVDLPILKEDSIDFGSRKYNIDRDEMPTNIFTLNVEKAIYYSKKEHNVYIVTSRRTQNNVIKCVRAIGIDVDTIPDKNIICGQHNKASIIVKLKAVEYYDDSPHHIVEIQNIRHLLPEEFKLFLSIPEKNVNIDVPAYLNLSDSDIKINVHRVLDFQRNYFLL